MGAKPAEYVASRDYGTREYELNAQVFTFGTHQYTIYQRAGSKKPTWYFRMYLVKEKRHLRKSLKTTDLAKAKELAADAVVDTVTKVKSGVRVLAITVGDLHKRYLEVLEGRKKLGSMIEGGLSEMTFLQQKYRINHGIKFIQATLCKGTEKAQDRRISTIEGKHWDGYLAYRDGVRAARGKTIRRDVIRDELLSIRKMWHYARKEGLCDESVIPVWSFDCEKIAPVRDRMDMDDYMKAIPILRAFVKDGKSDKKLYTRRLMQHVILVMANSGMRTGEVFGLQNKSVKIDKEKNECVLKIRPETSKVRRSRELTFSASRGGAATGTDINYMIRWIKQYQIHREPNDLVFAAFSDGQKEVRDDYYGEYKTLRKKLAEEQLDYLDTYHFRHFWITNRLNQGWDIHRVAKVAGTSVREIEATYSHVMTQIASADMNKKRRELEGSITEDEN